MRVLKFVANTDNIDVKYVLKNKFNMASSVITALKNNNGIIVNGLPATVRKTMFLGDLLELHIPDTQSDNIVKTCGKLDILYEDEDILCVNKPSGTPTHPSQNHYTDTLANYVCWYYKDIPFTFRASNRLDSYTSGIVIIAKNMYSASFLCSESFRRTKIKKTYLAVCRGKFENEKGVIDDPIGRLEGSTIKRFITPLGKYAHTEYEVLEETDDNTLVKLNLKTGRTHQIRVHMAHIGHPLLNDFLYDDLAEEGKNHFLHCGMVEFVHPYTQKNVTIKTSYYKQKTECN